MRHMLLVFLMLTTLLPAQVTHASEWVYIVNDGDTLWDFSRKNLNRADRWQALQKINGVVDPKKLQPGSRLRVPLDWVRRIPVQATVTALSGTAELLTPHGNNEVAVGDKISLGDQLQVAADSSLAIEFADGSQVTFFANSQVFFDQLSQFGQSGMVDTRFRLESGRVDTKAAKAVGAGSQFEVVTPSAISAVRGTEFRTTVKESSQISQVEVLEGTVAVRGKGTTRAVKAGFGTQVEPRKAPIVPRKLLAAPVFELPDMVTTPAYLLTWQSNAKAAQYRVEISDSANFFTVRFNRAVTASRVSLPDLPDGEYYLRVRAIDALGLEGFDNTQRLVMDTHPLPPFTLAPKDHEIFRSNAPVLRWTLSAEAQRYHVQVATDAAFSHPVLDDTVSGSHVTADVAPGQYWWRVASMTATGEEGPFGPARPFERRAEPVAPEMKLDDTAEQLSASWPASAPGMRYQVQVATDAAFTDLKQDVIVSENQLPLEASDQVQYLRMRIIDTDGYQGDWGAAQLLYPPQEGTWLKVLGIGLMGLILI